MTRQSSKSLLPVWLLLLFVAVASAVIDFFVPLMGDDLHLNIILNEKESPLRCVLSFCYGHYMLCNGRLFDSLGPVMANYMPALLMSALMGAMTASYFAAMLALARLLRPGRAAAAILFVALMLTILPWWDSMWLRVVQFNYLWSALFALLFVLCWRRSGWLPALLGFVAAASHELSALTLCAGFFLWLLCGRRYESLSGSQKRSLVGLTAGTIFALASPGLYLRFTYDNAISERFPFGSILLSSLPVSLLLAVVLLGFAFSARGRARLSCLFAGSWSLWFFIALIGSIGTLLVGVPGRTGWLAQTFAAVALVRLLPPLRVSRIVAAAAALWVVIHLSVVIREQIRACSEVNSALEQFANSDSAVISLSPTPRFGFSPLALGRVKGVPDADDGWLRFVFSKRYRNENVPFVVLGPDCRAIHSLPPGALHIHFDSYLLGDSVINATAIPSLYVISLLIIDPGDLRPAPLP